MTTSKDDGDEVTLTLSPTRRYFVNPYQEYDECQEEDDVGAKPADDINPYILDQLRHTLDVARDANFDGGIYTGPAGIAYMLIHISGNPNRTAIQKAVDNSLVQRNLLSQISYYQQRTPELGFLVGKVGVDAVAAVFFNMVLNPEASKKHLKAFESAAEYYKSPRYNRSEELLVGRAGYLCACLWLQEMLGTCPVQQQDLKEIWVGLVESGRRYSTANKSPCPLMYSYLNTEYLGAVHGVSSILQILLSFPTFCLEFPEHEKLIHDSIDYMLKIQYSSGNFPPEMDDVRAGVLLPEDELVHFCHGAPGAIYLLAKAYLHYKDNKYLEACISCGNVIWNKGLLRKGPGICHGVAGNGYAFLLLYRLTGDRSYLYKAKKFQEFMCLESFEALARVPDCPRSLFEGSAGVVCFLMDLLTPDDAVFPFFNIFYKYVPPSPAHKPKAGIDINVA